MPRLCMVVLGIVLFSFSLVFAQDQVDEPTKPQPKEETPQQDLPGVDWGFYFSAGKALRFFNLDRMNSKLATAGIEPFSGYVDDWNFELIAAQTRQSFFGIAGDFWDLQSGGALPKAQLAGWEILFRVGTALIDSTSVQVYPMMGIGYASRKVTLDGRLSQLPFTNIGKEGSVEITQQGMLLEAGVRLDIFHAFPDTGKSAFLGVSSLSLGWQGVPIFSDWMNGSDTVHGMPNDLIHTFFIRYNLGFGGGVRKATD